MPAAARRRRWRTGDAARRAEAVDPTTPPPGAAPRATRPAPAARARSTSTATAGPEPGRRSEPAGLAALGQGRCRPAAFSINGGVFLKGTSHARLHLRHAARAVSPPACWLRAPAARPPRVLAGLGALLALPAMAGVARARQLPTRCWSTASTPRFTTGSFEYMGARHMRNRYSQFVIAGGPIGAVQPARFASLAQGLLGDNLDITVALHNIKACSIALTHRDCGAANDWFPWARTRWRRRPPRPPPMPIAAEHPPRRSPSGSRR